MILKRELRLFHRYKLWTDEKRERLLYEGNCLSVANTRHEQLGGALYRGERLLIVAPYKGKSEKDDKGKQHNRR